MEKVHLNQINQCLNLPVRRFNGEDIEGTVVDLLVDYLSPYMFTHNFYPVNTEQEKEKLAKFLTLVIESSKETCSIDNHFTTPCDHEDYSEKATIAVATAIEMRYFVLPPDMKMKAISETLHIDMEQWLKSEPKDNELFFCWPFVMYVKKPANEKLDVRVVGLIKNITLTKGELNLYKDTLTDILQYYMSTFWEVSEDGETSYKLTELEVNFENISLD